MSNDVKVVRENDAPVPEAFDADDTAQASQDAEPKAPSKFFIKISKKPVPATPRGVLAE